MLQFISKRFVNGIFVLLGVIALIFFLFNVLPVNSARMTLGQRADAATLEAVEKEFRLNLSAPHRFMLYLNDISPISFHHTENAEAYHYYDQSKYSGFKLIPLGAQSIFIKKPYLGRSFQSMRSVNQILIEKIPATAALAIGAITLASIIGIILGTLAALYQHKFIDHFAVVTSVLGYSQPSYFAAIILAIVFGYYLHDYTGLEVQGSLVELDDLGDPRLQLKNLVLPIIALGIRPIAIITQLTRSSVLDVISQDYIRTAKAKGLSRRKVVVKHVLRNALNPVITSISGWFAALLAGAFFIEFIFNYSGLGLTTVNALLSFDFPVVMGAVLFIAFVFVLVNILVDILYGVLDPRISLKG